MTEYNKHLQKLNIMWDDNAGSLTPTMVIEYMEQNGMLFVPVESNVSKASSTGGDLLAEVIKLIDAEPELTDKMPAEMVEQIRKGDVDFYKTSMVMVVQMTKKNIKESVIGYLTSK